MVRTLRITLPLSASDIKILKAGDRVLLSGTVYTARDAAHQRLAALLDKNKVLPFDVAGQVIYYVGPTPPRPGAVIGSAGPTSSYRMDPYTPQLLKKGLKGMIGKGPRSGAVAAAIRKNKAVYFAAAGGAGALLSERIVKRELVAYEDLGAEAIYKLQVKDFPVIVAIDSLGGNVYTA